MVAPIKSKPHARLPVLICPSMCSDRITAMRTISRFTLIFAVAALPVAFAQDGWISLFNGKDFTGWNGWHGRETVDPATVCRIEGGELVWGAGTPGRTLTLSELSLFLEGCTLLARTALSPGAVTPRTWTPPVSAA